MILAGGRITAATPWSEVGEVPLLCVIKPSAGPWKPLVPHGFHATAQRQVGRLAAWWDWVWHGVQVTIVIAHRGANEEEPEHSLAAYLRALRMGVDGVECDIRLTADGVLVCVHDRRIDRTSSGTGVVSAMTFEELSRHDYSGGPDRWRDFESPMHADELRSQVLTLDKLLETMMSESDTISFSIETKHPTRYRRRVERALVECLARHGLDRPHARHRVRIMSFSAMAMSWVGKNAPQFDSVFLVDLVPPRFRDGSLPYGVNGAGISIRSLRKHPGYATKVHAAGGFLHCWTVNTVADVEYCLSLGVDGIISDRPDMVLEVLGR